MFNSRPNLVREQLSRKLRLRKKLLQNPPPDCGWVRAIREGLGMSARQLAERIGLKQTHVTRIEQGELRGTVTLNTLKRVANALDCELVVSIVPRTSLEDTLRKQAAVVAKRMVSRVSHSMSLEDQETSEKRRIALFKETMERLLRNPPRNLWDPE